MKKVMQPVAAVFFALFGMLVIALLMSYTFEALAFIFPDNFTSQIMGMVLFDVAAIAWILAFIYLCKSIMQYAFAFIGFVFALIGTLLMVAIDVMLGGQEMIEAPAWINEALIYGFIAAAIVHVILVYAYKLAAPEISADISLGIETANIIEEAMKQAEDELLRERGAMGRVIAPRLMNDVRRNLGLPVSGEVIDLPAYDVPEQTQAIPVQIPVSFMERVKAAGRVFVDPSPASASSPIPSPVDKTVAVEADKGFVPRVPPMEKIVDWKPAKPLSTLKFDTAEEGTIPSSFPKSDDYPEPADIPFKFKAAVDMGGIEAGVRVLAGTEVIAVLYSDGKYNLSEPNTTYAFARVSPEELHYYQTGEEMPAADNFRQP